MSVAFNTDGTLLATGSADKTCEIWSVPDYTPIKELTGHASGVKFIVFTPDKKYLLTAGGNTIRVNNAETFDYIRPVKGPATFIWSFAYIQPKNEVIMGSYDKFIRSSDVSTGKQISSTGGHEKSVLAVACSPDFKLFASGSLDETIKIWDAQNDSVLQTCTGHGGNIYDVAFSPDSKHIFSASNDNSVRVWDVETGKTIKNLIGHSKGVTCLAVSPDGYYVVSGSFDTNIRLWDWMRDECIYTFIGHTETINSLAFQPDGKGFVSASDDKTVMVWELLPEIFVNQYFPKEFNSEYSASDLTLPRAKDESKQDYKLREEKASEFRKQLIDKYYRKYLTEIKGKIVNN